MCSVQSGIVNTGGHFGLPGNNLSGIFVIGIPVAPTMDDKGSLTQHDFRRYPNDTYSLFRSGYSWAVSTVIPGIFLSSDVGNYASEKALNTGSQSKHKWYASVCILWVYGGTVIADDSGIFRTTSMTEVYTAKDVGSSAKRTSKTSSMRIRISQTDIRKGSIFFIYLTIYIPA